MCCWPGNVRPNHTRCNRRLSSLPDVFLHKKRHASRSCSAIRTLSSARLRVGGSETSGHIGLNHRRQLSTSSPCPHLDTQRDEASTKFDLLDRSLEPLPSNRSPRTDTSSVRIPAVPPRSAPVCALRQANDALPGENYSAVWACMEATEVRLRTIAFPEPCQRLYIQWGRLVFGSDVNGVPKSPQDLVSGFFHTRQEGGHSGGWPSIGMPV
ncbi:hypothetical protein T4C_4883 [Trichinella pseudospiralis]|uniref:Uncharacterized protein n=1 Tax=Trichinella pseudospiralis TaxID=6337 RepID=A0A0V1JWF5_TRIPS|nr:hypothetical protein T4C_4883 [Trichinella pseudospiralis]